MLLGEYVSSFISASLFVFSLFLDIHCVQTQCRKSFWDSGLESFFWTHLEGPSAVLGNVDGFYIVRMECETRLDVAVAPGWVLFLVDHLLSPNRFATFFFTNSLSLYCQEDKRKELRASVASLSYKENLHIFDFTRRLRAHKTSNSQGTIFSSEY